MKKVAFATGSRADYGIVRNYLKLLDQDQNIDLSLLVTGALLSTEFGHQVDLIYKDGFTIAEEIYIPVDTSSNKRVVHAMAVALDRFGGYFAMNIPDLLIILGDRYEMLSVAVAAAMNRIPILHLHGGEATFGNYDEFIRHAITKMSLFHFTAADEFRKRVIQLGEAPDRVFNLGALGAENCLNIDESMVEPALKGIAGRRYFVVLFHPETLTNSSVLEQVEQLLNAIEANADLEYVFLGSNADTNSNVIRKKISEYVASHENCAYYENLPTSGYHYLLKHALGLIGNSSSGLIEAPALGTYTINIGDRQEGRARGNSVIDVACSTAAIANAINRIKYAEVPKEIINPYFKENACENYYKTTLSILKRMEKGENNHPKKFFDLPF